MFILHLKTLNLVKKKKKKKEKKTWYDSGTHSC